MPICPAVQPPPLPPPPPPPASYLTREIRSHAPHGRTMAPRLDPQPVWYGRWWLAAVVVVTVAAGHSNGRLVSGGNPRAIHTSPRDHDHGADSRPPVSQSHWTSLKHARRIVSRAQPPGGAHHQAASEQYSAHDTTMRACVVRGKELTSSSRQGPRGTGGAVLRCMCVCVWGASSGHTPLTWP